MYHEFSTGAMKENEPILDGWNKILAKSGPGDLFANRDITYQTYVIQLLTDMNMAMACMCDLLMEARNESNNQRDA